VWCAVRMRLHSETSGSGQKVALLLHGMMGSSESWWRVSPQFVSRDYRVIALDLPGHGLSPRHPSLTMMDVAASVIETVSQLADGPPAVAMGHSFGGAVLAAATAELAPGRAIYVDAPTSSRGGWDRDAVRAEYESDRVARTVEGLRARRPFYSDRDCEVEALAAERFDPETAAGIASGSGGTWTPSSSPASLMVRASPSDYVSDEGARMLAARGVVVRDIPGAAHSIWYSDFERFMAAIDDWY
jgi:pimeloyl-ACP methyl ester carboxylesterase